MYNHYLHRDQRKALPTPSSQPKEGFANCHGSESLVRHLITIHIQQNYIRSFHLHSRLPLLSTVLSMRTPSPKLREPNLNYHRLIEGHISLLFFITCYIRRTQIRDTELNCVRKLCQQEVTEVTWCKEQGNHESAEVEKAFQMKMRKEKTNGSYTSISARW